VETGAYGSGRGLTPNLDRLAAEGVRFAHAYTPVPMTLPAHASILTHGETTHGLFAYDATLSVPLIVSAPQMAARSVEAPVSHVDVMPTILDLVGVGLDAPVDGQSLARLPSDDRPLYFEALDASITRGWAPLRGIVQRGWKYLELPEPELYDLAADPHEQRNLADRDPHVDLLRRVLQAGSAPDVDAPRVALDAEAAGRLRSGTRQAGRLDAPSRLPTTRSGWSR
jgi:arylsulfatase A-like enzyme